MIVLIYQHDCSPSVIDKAVKLIVIFDPRVCCEGQTLTVNIYNISFSTFLKSIDRL